MQVKNISEKTNFGRLYTSLSLKSQLKDGLLEQNLQPQLKSIQRLIRKNGLHKAQNVDIILNYTPENKFYGVISSKKEGIPYNPSYMCPVSTAKSVFDDFKTWVKTWDKAYSPESIENMKKLMDFVSMWKVVTKSKFTKPKSLSELIERIKSLKTSDKK